jgi:acyl-[acyl-carrier-protein]-phospholipid O-acyltransferase/long-chain-fatty-acid--[acyl-carrier-protein] ligase
MTGPTSKNARHFSTVKSVNAALAEPIAVEQSVETHANTERLPELYRDSSFWGMASTQFLGAFNDNLFKQLILLLATPTVLQLKAGSGEDLQSDAQFVFAAAFLIFSGFAGYLSDRYSKRSLTILCKVAECFIMLAGMIGFIYFEQIGVTGMFVVLFLMGTHSAFFGPVKYGILPELIRPTDLPRANGIFLMLTFLAIIFGVAIAGALLLVFADRVWMASLACIGVAILGTLTACAVRPLPAAQPGLAYDWSCWLIPKDTLRLIRRDRQLLWAIVVVAIFWMVGGMALQTVNAFGKSQLGLNELRTSALAASIGIGTAIGCMLGGYLSQGRVNKTIVTTGACGTVLMLTLLSLPGGPHGQLLGYWGSIPVLVLLGASSGMFIVPVQVALQSRPPREEKGRMIATMNQLSWIGVILGALIYKLCIASLEITGGPRSLIFGVTALLMLPVAIFYRPTDQQLSELTS